MLQESSQRIRKLQVHPITAAAALAGRIISATHGSSRTYRISASSKRLALPAFRGPVQEGGGMCSTALAT